MVLDYIDNVKSHKLSFTEAISMAHGCCLCCWLQMMLHTFNLLVMQTRNDGDDDDDELS